MGGATAWGRWSWPSAGGLSPRGRGDRSLPAAPVQDLRSIPAWAGQPLIVQRCAAADRVYPRVGGATRIIGLTGWSIIGLSPRGRGNQNLTALEVLLERSIPAWAGQPRRRWGSKSPTSGLSPRGRGNRSPSVLHGHQVGSIPAWAGQPFLSLPAEHRPTVYPRVGGATTGDPTSVPLSSGLSPRGRGNQIQER